MKKIILSCLVVLALVSIPLGLFAANETKIEVLYMNHGPLLPSIGQIKKVFAQYGSKISVSWYDFETKEGEQFMAQKGINQHVPLVIWMGGKNSIPVNGKVIKFVGFPTGAGPAFFQGKWTMDDLRVAIEEMTSKK
jgi:hypothetical protein